MEKSQKATDNKRKWMTDRNTRKTYNSVLGPVLVSTYVKNMAVYMGRTLDGHLAKDDDVTKKFERSITGLESMVDSFEIGTSERAYMEKVYSIVVDHAESRNRIWKDYDRKIRFLETKRDEYLEQLEQFKGSARKFIRENYYGPAGGIVAGSIAKLFGLDLQSSAAVALVAGTATWTIKELIWRFGIEKGNETAEQKVIASYDKKINDLRAEETAKKSLVYERAFNLAKFAYYKHIAKKILPKLRVIKQKVKCKSSEVNEIEQGIRSTMKVQEGYENDFSSFFKQEDTFSPVSIHQEESSRMETLMAEHYKLTDEDSRAKHDELLNR